MEKRKNRPISRWHTLAVILLGVLFIASIRFPLQFLGDLYPLTPLLYLIIGLFITAYVAWLFRVRHIRFLAAALFVIMIVVTVSRIIYFRDDQGWCPVNYLTLPYFPIGIRVEEYFDICLGIMF